MKISSLEKLLKNLFLIELKDKSEISEKFEIGEILKGRILKQLGSTVLIDVEKKGVYKAYSKILIKSKNILLKVIKNSPELVLKILKDLPDEDKFESIQNIYKQLKFPPETLKKIFITTKEIKNSEIFKEILKKLPEKLGLDYEYNILKENIDKVNNLKHEALLKNDLNFLNFIENFQKLCNQNFLIFPIFFKEDTEYFDYAVINFKKKGNKEDNIFSIAIFLKLKDNTDLKILILQKSKTLSLSFSTNNEFFLKKLKTEIKSLIKSIENNTHFKVINYSVFIDKELNEMEPLLELMEIDTTEGFINLKA